MLMMRVSAKILNLNSEFLNLTLRFVFIPLFLFAVAFSSCNKCKTEPILIYANKDILAAGAFKPGTFWVYQNDSTLERDSVFVTSFQDTQDTVLEDCDNKSVPLNYRQVIYTFATSTFFHRDYTWKIQVDEPLLLSKDSNSYDIIYEDASCTDTTTCRIVDTLFAAGVYYYNIYERIDSPSFVEDGLPVHYYILPDVGIIKKEIITNDSTVQSWSVTKIKIVQ